MQNFYRDYIPLFPTDPQEVGLKVQFFFALASRQVQGDLCLRV